LPYFFGGGIKMRSKIFLGLVAIVVCSLSACDQEDLISKDYQNLYSNAGTISAQEIFSSTDSQGKFRFKQLIPHVQKSTTPWEVSNFKFNKRSLPPEFQDIEWWNSCLVIGDINSDGIDDLLIMEEYELIAIVSEKKGKKFAILWHPTYTPATKGAIHLFDCEEAMVGNVDKDKTNEIIMISAGTWENIPQPLRIRIYGFDNDNKIFIQKLEKKICKYKT